MFCAYEGPANIMRLYGRGQAMQFSDPGFAEEIARFGPAFARARDIMTPDPVTVPRGAPVEEVLALMNARKITVLFVTEADDLTRPIGIAHIHDLVP